MPQVSFVVDTILYMHMYQRSLLLSAHEILNISDSTILKLHYSDLFVLSCTHEILNISDSTILKLNYSDSFVLTTTLIYKYSTSNSYYLKYVQIISLLIQIHRFRKTIIILINDSSALKCSYANHTYFVILAKC